MTPHVVSVKVYTGVFATLMLLLVLTVAVALVEHPGIGLSIALGIAGLKATLILLFFMHLRYDTVSVRLAAVAGFLWLSLLIDTAEEISRPERRAVPCDRQVLAALRAQLARPASLRVPYASPYSLRN